MYSPFQYKQIEQIIVEFFPSFTHYQMNYQSERFPKVSMIYLRNAIVKLGCFEQEVKTAEINNYFNEYKK